VYHASHDVRCALAQFDGKVEEAVVVAVCRAIVDDEVLSFDIAEVLEPSPQRVLRCCVN
jgi:hypothetical protein